MYEYMGGILHHVGLQSLQGIYCLYEFIFLNTLIKKFNKKNWTQETNPVT